MRSSVKDDWSLREAVKCIKDVETFKFTNTWHR